MSGTRPKMLLAAVCLIAGCADAPRPVDQAVLDQAERANVDCLVAAAASSDDGVSDAASIALGIMPLRSQEFQRAVTLRGSTLNLQARAMFMRKAEERQIGIAIGAVLRARADRAARPAEPLSFEATSAAYIACLNQATTVFDDGASDIRGIAFKVQSRCEPEFRSSVRAAATGLDPEQRIIFERKLEEKQIGFVTSVIEDARRRQK